MAASADSLQSASTGPDWCTLLTRALAPGGGSIVAIRFSMREGVDALVEGTKTTTIRRNPDRWLDLFERKLDLDIHYADKPPWQGGKSHKVGVREFAFMRIVQGDAFTHDDAVRDGFNHKMELLQALARLHNYTMDAVKNERWAIIHFGQWRDGPHWPEGHP